MPKRIEIGVYIRVQGDVRLALKCETARVCLCARVFTVFILELISHNFDFFKIRGQNILNNVINVSENPVIK